MTFAASRLKHLSHRVKKRRSAGTLILMYHRVAEPECDPWGLCVSPSHFRQHLEVLREHGSVIPLQRLVESVAAGKVNRQGVVVTFDDGYADNYHTAKPLLDHFDVPATVFVTTGTIGDSSGFWWDELANFLLRRESVPAILDVTIDGRNYLWAIEESEFDTQSPRWYESWKAWEPAPTKRHELYFTLWRIMSRLRKDQQDQVLERLADWIGLGRDRYRSNSQLTAEQVSKLAEDDLLEIGAHTVTHTSLPILCADVQRNEIFESKSYLEQVLERPIRSFAFPYGNYVQDTVALVRAAGFTSACTTARQMVKSGADCFGMPRLQVLDCDGEAFAKKLSRWFAQD